MSLDNHLDISQSYPPQLWILLVDLPTFATVSSVDRDGGIRIFVGGCTICIQETQSGQYDVMTVLDSTNTDITASIDAATEDGVKALQLRALVNYLYQRYEKASASELTEIAGTALLNADAEVCEVSLIPDENLESTDAVGVPEAGPETFLREMLVAVFCDCPYEVEARGQGMFDIVVSRPAGGFAIKLFVTFKSAGFVLDKVIYIKAGSVTKLVDKEVFLSVELLLGIKKELYGEGPTGWLEKTRAMLINTLRKK
ncbi:MAG: hypothetical protein HY817_01965 [Candidatus Abawacabacteria bacterium]|nr:hypothetical protein [Candidatus Abawacabacteria bacterium]